MRTDENQGLSTRCVHVGEINDQFGAPHTPLYNTSTFIFPNTQELVDVVQGHKSGNLYTRYGMHPNIKTLETKLASLEGAEAALSFGSGMAAEAATLLAHGRKGIVCVGDVYGGTLELLDSQLRSLGLPVYLLLGSELDQLESVLQKGAGLLYFETPTNPLLGIFDIAEMCQLAHKHNVLVCIDNTFATPINQNPLALGADLVVHSATKYLGGHSDITAGAVMGSQELINEIFPWRKNLGQVPAPEVASLLCRSIRSLVIRVERQNLTAQNLAESLEGHPAIKKVLYPGLPSHAQHYIASQQMKGYGGMFTLDLNATYEQTTRFADHLNLISIAPSLGGPESLCTQPVTTSHEGLSTKEREQRGITSSLIRFSIGFEDAEDLINDIKQALEYI